MDVDEATPSRPKSTDPKEAHFGNTMSGWDQLFGGMAAAPAPEPARPKDTTPEQKAAAAEAEAMKMREARAKEAQERKKEQEQAKAKEKEKAEREKARAQAETAAAAAKTPVEKRAQSVTYVPDLLTIARMSCWTSGVRFAAIWTIKRPSTCWQVGERCMRSRYVCPYLLSYQQESLAQDRRSLRASKFGAGLLQSGTGRS